eukprot:2321174-Pyramimonas_sp.AAC.1
MEAEAAPFVEHLKLTKDEPSLYAHQLDFNGKDAIFGVDSVGTVSAALTAFAAIQVRTCRVVLFKPGKYVAHQTNPCPSNPQASGRSLTTQAHAFTAGCKARLGYQRWDLRRLQDERKRSRALRYTLWQHEFVYAHRSLADDPTVPLFPQAMGGAIGDVYLSSAFKNHDRRIPLPGFEAFGTYTVQVCEPIYNNIWVC